MSKLRRNIAFNNKYFNILLLYANKFKLVENWSKVIMLSIITFDQFSFWHFAINNLSAYSIKCRLTKCQNFNGMYYNFETFLMASTIIFVIWQLSIYLNILSNVKLQNVKFDRICHFIYKNKKFLFINWLNFALHPLSLFFHPLTLQGLGYTLSGLRRGFNTEKKKGGLSSVSSKESSFCTCIYKT